MRQVKVRKSDGDFVGVKEIDLKAISDLFKKEGKKDILFREVVPEESEIMDIEEEISNEI